MSLGGRIQFDNPFTGISIAQIYPTEVERGSCQIRYRRYFRPWAKILNNSYTVYCRRRIGASRTIVAPHINQLIRAGIDNAELAIEPLP